MPEPHSHQTSARRAPLLAGCGLSGHIGVRYIGAAIIFSSLEQFMTDEESAQRDTRSLFERLTRADDPVFEQIDRNAKSLLQSALTRLDVVSREEFDAQAAVLKRTRERLEALEAQIAALDEALSASERQGDQ